jgi:LacI family transcriptional regulator
VLVTLSSSTFRNEGEREIGFRTAMRQMAPRRPVRELTDTHGLDASLSDRVARILADDPAIDAVYSVGGGNRAIVDAFARAGRSRRAAAPCAPASSPPRTRTGPGSPPAAGSAAPAPAPDGPPR